MRDVKSRQWVESRYRREVLPIAQNPFTQSASVSQQLAAVVHFSWSPEHPAGGGPHVSAPPSPFGSQ